MKVGDLVKMSHAGGYWVGWIVELLKSPWVVIWRPEQGFQTWNMETQLFRPEEWPFFSIEVINDG